MTQTSVTYVFLLGICFLVLLGLLFTLFANSNRTKFKPDADFNDLAPGLNIDLSYYISDDFSEKKNSRKKKEEMLSLLNP